MKKLLLILMITLTATIGAFAQRFAYVDTDYILEQIPEYQEAQTKLDEIAAQWQKEIEAKYDEIEEMYKAYQAEQVLLTEEMRKKREQEIIRKEKEVKELQKRKFGYEGELFQKRKELVKPIQDKVYDAVKKLAKARSYDFIFDKASGLVMLHANPDYDKSDEILKELGYSPGESDKKQNK